jgi:para-nitrobenzyl esterase
MTNALKSPWPTGALIFGLLMSASRPAFAAPVTIDAGALDGTTTKGVNAYLGVPFAAPPVGYLRWRAPQPVQAWRGVRKADAFAPDCMQRPLDYVPGSGYIRPVSEDCLYLNLWKPAAAPPAKPLPVMVWIYGGGFTMGSGAWPAYNGRNLAAEGVILVTLNYRLGRFGFFGHPALSKADSDGVLAN